MQYTKLWALEGAGVMVFQPNNKDRSMFYLTLEELNSAKEDAERSNNDDLVESFRRILDAVAKIDPDTKAGYVINDQQGMRYFEVDYDKLDESTK